MGSHRSQHNSALKKGLYGVIRCSLHLFMKDVGVMKIMNVKIEQWLCEKSLMISFNVLGIHPFWA